LLPDTYLFFQYSPEIFSNTEIDYAVEVCAAVMDAVQPTADRPMILNLPETVEYTTPNVYADMIEWFGRNIPNRDSVILSLHTHNDRGTGIAATELGLLAGAQRVEGTLFGNGERTGNLDIVTVALNLYMHGIDPGLAFDDLPAIRQVYESCTRMSVPERHPYAGELVFTAFSGSHQDAIKKGFDRRELEADPGVLWEVPYLTIDPRDIGRDYEAIIRINSQSGKGGVAHVLARDYGYKIPKSMHPEIGEMAARLADDRGNELSSEEIRDVFEAEVVNRCGPLELLDFDIDRSMPLCMPSKVGAGSTSALKITCNTRSGKGRRRLRRPTLLSSWRMGGPSLDAVSIPISNLPGSMPSSARSTGQNPDKMRISCNVVVI